MERGMVDRRRNREEGRCGGMFRWRDVWRDECVEERGDRGNGWIGDIRLEQGERNGGMCGWMFRRRAG